jgi:hypothetical protein
LSGVTDPFGYVLPLVGFVVSGTVPGVVFVVVPGVVDVVPGRLVEPGVVVFVPGAVVVPGVRFVPDCVVLLGVFCALGFCATPQPAKPARTMVAAS